MLPVNSTASSVRSVIDCRNKLLVKINQTV